MRRIRATNTKPELTVRRYLYASGLRFRIHFASLSGKPDIVLPKYRTVVFVHGCFWHQHRGCKHSARPQSNREYWEPKLKKTVVRDSRHRRVLIAAGWHVHIVWECQISEHRLNSLVGNIKGLQSKRRSPSRSQRKDPIPPHPISPRQF
jgi:DNA mismatch endonuclease, patch repair protein